MLGCIIFSPTISQQEKNWTNQDRDQAIRVANVGSACVVGNVENTGGAGIDLGESKVHGEVMIPETSNMNGPATEISGSSAIIEGKQIDLSRD